MSEQDPKFQSRGRGLLERWRLWAAMAVAAVALYTIFGFLIVPKIARAQIVKQARAKLHREATVERVRFNPFTLVLVVEGLQTMDRDGSPLSHIDRLTADFQVSGILRRAWRFREIVIEKPHAVARIARDGRPSIADLFEEPPGHPPPRPNRSPCRGSWWTGSR